MSETQGSTGRHAAISGVGAPLGTDQIRGWRPIIAMAEVACVAALMGIDGETRELRVLLSALEQLAERIDPETGVARVSPE